MERKDLLASITARVSTALDMLEASGLSGNITITLHRDEKRVRKVEVTHNETWVLPA